MSYFRLMTALPALPTEPQKPPLSLAQVVDTIREELHPYHWELATALLLKLDVANAEAVLQGRENLFDSRALLSQEDFTSRGGYSRLPSFLQSFLQKHDETGHSAGYSFDALWKAYYDNMVEVAEQGGSRFLEEWAAWEVPLVRALARQRSNELGVEVAGSLPEEPPAPANHTDLLSKMAEESNPMERERLLDRARLSAVQSLVPHDAFSMDAVLGYLTAMLILERWDLPDEVKVEELLEVFE